MHDVALTNFLEILGACGLGPISTNTLKAMGNEGLISCHCHAYLANAWCKHACAFAFDRGSLVLKIKVLDKSNMRNVEVT